MSAEVLTKLYLFSNTKRVSGGFQLPLKTEALGIRYFAPKIINIEEISYSETHERRSYSSMICGKQYN